MATLVDIVWRKTVLHLNISNQCSIPKIRKSKSLLNYLNSLKRLTSVIIVCLSLKNAVAESKSKAIINFTFICLIITV